MNGLRRLAALAAAGWLGVAAAHSEAGEEPRKFLEGLRQRGYFEVALDYLEQMRNSPLADRQFKEAVDYEAGATLIDGARAARSMTTREEQLGEAKAKFEKFLADHPQHPLASSARRQLANLLVECGRIKAAQAGVDGRTVAEKEHLLSDARTLYGEAQTVFTTLEAGFAEAHKKFPKLIEQKAPQYEARERVRRDLLESRLALATVRYEIAQTYPPGEAGNRDNLAAAAKGFNEFAEKHGNFLAGMYARLWEARCYKELGHLDKALAALQELLNQPDEPDAFRLMKSKAMMLYLETALLPKAGKEQEALAAYSAWANRAQASEQTSVEGLAIKYLAGRLAGAEAKPAEPANFAEARDRAKHALERMTQTERQWKMDQEKGVKETEKQHEKDIAAARQEALKYYRMALQTAPADTPINDLNTIRSFLVYLYWASDDLYEAAVMGEFLARHYPDAPGARQSAKTAMAAYARIFNEAPPQHRQFESDCVMGIADYIARRWAGQPEADEARMMLTRVAVINHEPVAAQPLDK